MMDGGHGARQSANTCIQDAVWDNLGASGGVSLKFAEIVAMDPGSFDSNAPSSGSHRWEMGGGR